MAEKRITHAMKFRDKVWEAPRNALTTVERLVLLCYADHLYNGSDTGWVVFRRLMDRCGIKSATTVTRVLVSLQNKGWLVMVNPSRCRTSSAHYRTVIPDEVAPLSGATSKIAVAPLIDESAPLIDESAPLSGADCSTQWHLPSGEESLKTLPAAASPPDSVPATRSEPENLASVTAIDAKAQLRAMLAGKPSAKVSRWATPRPETPNPNYDPTAARRLAANTTEGTA